MSANTEMTMEEYTGYSTLDGIWWPQNMRPSLPEFLDFKLGEKVRGRWQIRSGSIYIYMVGPPSNTKVFPA